MADLIAYTDLQGYLSAGLQNEITFGEFEITTATQVCSMASDAVKASANRTFEPIAATASTRYFTATRPYSALPQDYLGAVDWSVVFPMLFSQEPPQLEVDDFFLTPLGAQVIGDITVSDYVTGTTYTPVRGWPYNAASKGKPFTRLEFAVGTALPITSGRLAVTAKWGWPSVPAGVMNACLLQANRWFKRKDAPFGVAGIDSMGGATRLLAQVDPDVAVGLSAYRRHWAAV